MKDLYTKTINTADKNLKRPPEEIERHPMFTDWKTTVKMATVINLQIQCNPYQHSNSFWGRHGTGKANPQIHTELQTTQKSQKKTA